MPPIHDEADDVHLKALKLHQRDEECTKEADHLHH